MNNLPPEQPRVRPAERNSARYSDYLAERRKSPGYVSATELLSDPKMNLTARGRRKLGKKRVIRYVSTVEPKSVYDSIAAKVKEASIVGLVRLCKKSESRITKGQRVLADLAPDSMFRPSVEREISLERLINAAATAEFNRRTTAAPVKDARNPQHKRKAALVAAVAGGVE